MRKIIQMSFQKGLNDSDSLSATGSVRELNIPQGFVTEPFYGASGPRQALFGNSTNTKNAKR